MIFKCAKISENDKSKRVFNSTMVSRTAETALSLLVLDANRQKVSTYTPNHSSVFCNKYPKDNENLLLKPSPSKMYIYTENRLITVADVRLKNGLYDVLTVVRNPMGAYAYRAQLMSNLGQINEFLQGPNELVKSKSDDRKTFSHPSSPDSKLKERLPKLDCDRAISSIPISSPDQHVFCS